MTYVHQEFFNKTAQISHHITSEVSAGLLENENISVGWFCSKEGLLTCKVFLRKYLLKCWEFFNSNKNSRIGKTLSFLKKSGEFVHEECLFDFIFVVSYEQLTKVCEIMKMYKESNISLKKTDFNKLFTTSLELIRPKLIKALQNSRHGCVTDCQLRTIPNI